MPYIDKRAIDKNTYQSLDSRVDQLIKSIEATYDDNEIEGVMNYIITRLISGTFGRQGWKYTRINRAMGVLECAKQEFYRRLAGPYEDKAIERNGDIPEYMENKC